MTRYLWAPAKIENSGFSSERKFEVQLPGDGGKVVGAAYIEHFLDQNREPLSEGIPPYGQTMNGFVKVRVLRKQGDTLFVEFPGTDVFHVPHEALEDSWTK